MTEFKIQENVQGKETYGTACVQTLAVYLVLLAVFAAYFSVFEIDVKFWASAALMVLPVLFSSSILYRKKGRRKKAVLLLATALVCMAAGNLWKMRGFLPLVDAFVKQYNQFYVDALPVPEGEAWRGGVLIVLAGIQLLLSTVLVLSARAKKTGLALALVLAIPVVLAAVVGCMPSWEASWGLVASGAFYLIASHQSGKLLRNMGSVAAVLGIVYICSVIAVPEIEAYRETHKTEYRKIKDTLIGAQQINLGEIVSGNADNGDDNYSEGGIGKGNLKGLEEHRPKGAKKMEITLPEKPYSTVYRREYIGVRYTGDKWKKKKSPEDYLDFPGDLKRLKELADSLDSSSVEKVEEGIDASFEDLSYSLTPGEKPEGEDFTEYFLFENKKGFCVHFATAATLLYRGCGYPARYVEGYAVPASVFYQQEDGTYKADVTDEMAHAWSETLDEELGWQMREHTKSYTGTTDTVEEEIPPAVEEPLPDETNTAAEDGQETNHAEDITEKAEEAEGKEEDSFGGKQIAGGRHVLGSVLLVTGILALGAALFLLQQKIRYQKKLYRFRKKKDNQGIAGMYQAVYELCENFSGGKCQEEQMKQEFPQLSEEEWDWMYDCAQRAAFGGKSISKEEQKRMYRLYKKLRKEMLAEMSRRRKIWFIFVKGN